MTLRLRIILALCGGLVVTLAAGYFAGTLAAASLQKSVSDAHDAHLLATLEANVQSRLAIGLSLQQLGALQPAIELERANAPGVLSIDLFSDKGVLLYSTDRSAVGSQVPAEWVLALAQLGRWHLQGQAERVIGARIEDDLGAAIGGIALTIDHEAKPTGGARTPLLNTLSHDRLVWGLLASLLAAVVAGAWALARVFRPAHDALAVLSATDVAPQPTTTHGLAQAAWARKRLWAALHRDLDDGLAKLKALDRET